MVSKKTKQAKRAAKQQPDGGAEHSGAEAGPSTPKENGKTTPPPTPALAPPESQADIAKRAEKIKEQGNTAFRAGKFAEAIDLYTRAIETNPLEPSFLTNRAASYMAMKRFRPALDDCQQAAHLQSSSPSAKTLLRLARCQLMLGQPTPALSTLRAVLALEPKNEAGLQLQKKVCQLEEHMHNFERAKETRDWGMARLALDRVMQGSEAEGGEIPTEWRVWRVELEIARGNWEAANASANDALRQNPNSPEIMTLRGLVLFLSGKLAQALTNISSALRLDPSHGPAAQLRRRVKDVERLKDEGNVLFKAGRWLDAVDKYSEALEKIGSKEEEGKGGQIRATLLSNRATTFVKIDRNEEALTDIEESLSLFPSSFKALRTRARIHVNLEHWDRAIADFKAAVTEAQGDGSTSDADVRALKGELKKAEAGLKRSKSKDYYKILGVGRECGEGEIKKAYRRESLKHHPDKGGDEERFKLVVEAHSVLSDPQKRARYDNGDDDDDSGPFGSGGGGGFGGMSQEDIAQLFAQFGGGGAGFRTSFGGGGFGGAQRGHSGGGGFSTYGF